MFVQNDWNLPAHSGDCRFLFLPSPYHPLSIEKIPSCSLSVLPSFFPPDRTFPSENKRPIPKCLHTKPGLTNCQAHEALEHTAAYFLQGERERSHAGRLHEALASVHQPVAGCVAPAPSPAAEVLQTQPLTSACCAFCRLACSAFAREVPPWPCQ